MNALGLGSVFLIVFCWGGAALTLFRTGLWKELQTQETSVLGVWRDRTLRSKFLLFLSFCSIGVFAGIVGVLWGGLGS